jgi:predicted transporter
MKDWIVFIATSLTAILFGLLLIGGGIYLQKWIHSPVCNCSCPAEKP